MVLLINSRSRWPHSFHLFCSLLLVGTKVLKKVQQAEGSKCYYTGAKKFFKSV